MHLSAPPLETWKQFPITSEKKNNKRNEKKREIPLNVNRQLNRNFQSEPIEWVNVDWASGGPLKRFVSYGTIPARQKSDNNGKKMRREGGGGKEGGK